MDQLRTPCIGLVALAATLGIHCAETPTAPVGGLGPHECERCDGWAGDDTPDRLGEMEVRYDQLAPRGRLERLPWPGYGWPHHRDGIACRWEGAWYLSPVERYELAFTGDDQATRWERAAHGTGLDEIERWWSHANGWAAAALLEPEPLHAVEWNGVRFEVADVEALLAELYFDVEAVPLGNRCRAQEVERDDDGRIADEACRDVNAGSFHVALANLIARQGRGLAADFEAGFRVDNRVIVGYEVVASTNLDEGTASDLVGGDGVVYPRNDQAERFRRVRTDVEYLPSSAVGALTSPSGQRVDELTWHAVYEYLLELSAAGDVLGGEWIGRSLEDHPDFLWVPVHHARDGDEARDLDNPFIAWEDVQTLLALSRDPEHAATAASPDDDTLPERETSCGNWSDDDGDGREDCDDVDCGGVGDCVDTCELLGRPDEHDARADNSTHHAPTLLEVVTDDEPWRNPRTLPGSIYPAGDVDWYVIPVNDEPGGVLFIQLGVNYLSEDDLDDDDLEVCALYTKLEGGRGYCTEGRIVEEGDLRLCCLDGWRGINLEAEYLGPDDSGLLFVRVRGREGVACGRYELRLWL